MLNIRESEIELMKKDLLLNYIDKNLDQITNHQSQEQLKSFGFILTPEQKELSEIVYLMLADILRSNTITFEMLEDAFTDVLKESKALDTKLGVLEDISVVRNRLQEAKTKARFDLNDKEFNIFMQLQNLAFSVYFKGQSPSTLLG